jgi:hypothetical protein
MDIAGQDGCRRRTASQNGRVTLNSRPDLYRDTAVDYDRYRPQYPDALIDDLVLRTGADGTGRLLDLACGTGQACFALRGWFAEIWAVDQEPDMISLVRQKAAALADPPRFEFRTESAENLAAPEDSFDLDVGPVPRGAWLRLGSVRRRPPRGAPGGRAKRPVPPGRHIRPRTGPPSGLAGQARTGLRPSQGPPPGSTGWRQAVQSRRTQL